MDIRLQLMCGTDVPIPECQLILHQPSIKEISFLGEQKFFQAVQCLTISKNMLQMDESLLSQTNNFQIFMMVMTQKETAERKADVVELLHLLFPQYKISVLPRSIAFNLEGGQMINLDDSNFDIFQETVKQVFCFTSGPMDQSSFNPKDTKAKEIAQKLMRGRQRVAAQNGQAQSSIFSQYLSVLTVGLESMSLHDCMNLTMFQLFDLIERYGMYTSWDIDIRSRLAGAKADTKLDNWMKNIH